MWRAQRRLGSTQPASCQSSLHPHLGSVVDWLGSSLVMGAGRLSQGQEVPATNTPVGQIVVKVNGQWVEARIGGTGGVKQAR